jgi:hypothetical protein
MSLRKRIMEIDDSMNRKMDLTIAFLAFAGLCFGLGNRSDLAAISMGAVFSLTLLNVLFRH